MLNHNVVEMECHIKKMPAAGIPRTAQNNIKTYISKKKKTYISLHLRFMGVCLIAISSIS